MRVLVSEVSMKAARKAGDGDEGKECRMLTARFLRLEVAQLQLNGPLRAEALETALEILRLLPFGGIPGFLAAALGNPGGLNG